MGDLVKLTIKVEVTIDLTKELYRELALITEKEVAVGVPGEKTFRSGEPINNATIAYLMEHGSPAQNIPARPFLEPGVKDAQPQSIVLMRAVAVSVLNGNSSSATLDAVGIVNQVAVKKRITSNTPPPLAPSTLAARKRRGVSRTNTLVDTGALLNSISYVVRRKQK